VAVLFANAPFQAPDENDHYLRVFQLSEGTLVGEKHGNDSGGELPILASDVTNTEGLPFHSERKMTRALFERLLHPVFVDWSQTPRAFRGFPHTVVYPPAAYVPQTAAVFAGRMLRIGPLGLMYLARLGGFAASVALCFAALRMLPVFRWTTLVILLCPMSLYLFGSVASDGLLIAGAALLVAILARLEVERDRPVGTWEQVAAVALAAFLSLAKPVYLPFAAVALFILVPRLVGARRKALFCAATLVCCLLPILLWLPVAASVYAPADGIVPVDPAAQANYLIGAPMAFLALVAKTIGAQYVNTYRWMVGTLGWGDTPMPRWFYATFAFGIAGCLVLESAGAKAIRWPLRAVMAAAALAVVILIYAAQYASWNPPGSHDPILGIEGRYFLPVLPLLALAFPPLLPRSPRVLIVALAGTLSVICAGVCLWSVVFRYYVPSRSFPAIDRPARLTGFSIRALVGVNENMLITGFVVGGQGLETLLIRADAPGPATLGDSAALASPTTRVLSSEGTVLGSSTGLGGTGLTITVPEGRYTVEVHGTGAARGIVQEEIRELSHDGTRLSNVSSRGYVGKAGNMMVVGLVVGGTGADPVLGRAAGPSLRQFGIAAAIDRPALEIGPVGRGSVVDSGWENGPAKASISAASSSVGAFPFSRGSADSAAVVSLAPGTYTMKVYGADGTTGIALAELYELP
jgi:uncharacterized membrane protein